jgi:rhamnose utilization protein RhaD (predicted bifunctional aldolase and dehydrogenase)
LRPSIETSLHAVIARRVVIHVHCVATIALAIRTDACEVLADRLAGFHWAFVPYARPGARLAALVAAARGPQTDVIVLGNHGLIVAADTVAAADALLARVTAALAATVRPAPGPDATALAALAGAGYAPAALAGAGLAPAALAGAGLAPAGADHPLHGVATDPARLALALQGSAWPDHVIFCGPGSVALHPGETPADAAARHMARGLAAPVFILVPGQGALLREDAGAGALALARCLGEVLARVEPGAAIVTLSDVETAELLDWDAEKYRQSLNAV